MEGQSCVIEKKFEADNLVTVEHRVMTPPSSNQCYSPMFSE